MYTRTETDIGDWRVKEILPHYQLYIFLFNSVTSLQQHAKFVSGETGRNYSYLSWAVGKPLPLRVVFYSQTFGPQKDKAHRRQCKCCHLKLTCKGTWRQVFICLRIRTPYPPFTHCICVYNILIHTIQLFQMIQYFALMSKQLISPCFGLSDFRLYRLLENRTPDLQIWIDIRLFIINRIRNYGLWYFNYNRNTINCPSLSVESDTILPHVLFCCLSDDITVVLTDGTVVLLSCPLFRIRIHLIRIRIWIQYFRLNPDPGF